MFQINAGGISEIFPRKKGGKATVTLGEIKPHAYNALHQSTPAITAESPKREREERMGLKSGLKEAAPFAAMVVVEWGEVGMVTLAKAALNTGISTFVYLVYYNSLGVVLLFPLFIFRTYRFLVCISSLALQFRQFLS